MEGSFVTFYAEHIQQQIPYEWLRMILTFLCYFMDYTGIVLTWIVGAGCLVLLLFFLSCCIAPLSYTKEKTV